MRLASPPGAVQVVASLSRLPLLIRCLNWNLSSTEDIEVGAHTTARTAVSSAPCAWTWPSAAACEVLVGWVGGGGQSGQARVDFVWWLKNGIYLPRKNLVCCVREWTNGALKICYTVE